MQEKPAVPTTGRADLRHKTQRRNADGMVLMFPFCVLRKLPPAGYTRAITVLTASSPSRLDRRAVAAPGPAVRAQAQVPTRRPARRPRAPPAPARPLRRPCRRLRLPFAARRLRRAAPRCVPAVVWGSGRARRARGTSPAAAAIPTLLRRRPSRGCQSQRGPVDLDLARLSRD
jgi:hypothetical protein